MSSTPLTARQNKRKSPASAPVTRKRARRSDDVDHTTPNTSRPGKQQTLTQIRWVDSPTGNHQNGLEMQEIRPQNSRRGRASMTRKSSLRKRDSTLTQMQFYTTPDEEGQQIQDEYLPLPTYDGATETTENAVAPASKKATLFEERRTSSMNSKRLDRRREVTPEIDTNDHRPTKRKKKEHTVIPLSTARRRSGRLATKTDIHHDEDQIRGESFEMSPSKSNRTTEESRRKRPNLTEIKDSLDSSEDIQPLPETAENSPQPQTPRRNRRVVPSSQSPESVTSDLTRSTMRTSLSPTKLSARRPLHERSVNLPPLFRDSAGKSTGMLSPGKGSPRRKICVLKVPSRALLPRSSRVYDSQQDIYSLQPTSSPQRRKGSSSPIEKSTVRQDGSPEIASAEVEIPPTSSETEPVADDNGDEGSSDIDMENSLPSLAELMGTRTRSQPRPLIQTSSSLHHQATAQDSVVVHDFVDPGKLGGSKATENTTAVDGADEMLLDYEVPTQLITPRPSKEDGKKKLGATAHKSSASDGAQVAQNLQQDGLSILSTSGLRSSAKRRATKSPELATPRPVRKARLSTPTADLESVDTPIPTPRLVRKPNVSLQALNSDSSKHASEPVLPTLSHQTSTHISTTKVPLNDTLVTSSPPLRPIQPVIQRSVYPASMPRPSQISTQDPTQNYLPSTAPNIFDDRSEAERITIKDSSSCHQRVSQLPEYEESLNVQLVADSEDEPDEFDLDPRSESIRPSSVRKPRVLQDSAVLPSLQSLQSIKLPVDESPALPHNETTVISPPKNKKARSKPKSKSNSKSKSVPKSKSTSKSNPHPTISEKALDDDADLYSSQQSPMTRPLQNQYEPIIGFDNDTQSNFTQGGHVTAAYIHRQREDGAWPEWYTPKPYQVTAMRKDASS